MPSTPAPMGLNVTIGRSSDGLILACAGTGYCVWKLARWCAVVWPTSTGSEATCYQRLREHLAYLGMSAAAEHLAAALNRRLKEHRSATQVLEEVLSLQEEDTRARRTRGRLRFAHYPVYKTLADFDLDVQPSLDRK